MKLFALLFLTGLALCHPSSKGLPSFVWIGDLSSDIAPFLKIRFPDNGDDDTAILQRFNPIPVGPTERDIDVDNCIFHGYLENESNVYVTVTGCPDSNTYQVQFNSKRLRNQMFEVINGVVNSVRYDPSKLATREIEDEDTKEEFLPLKFDRDMEPLNPNGYITKIKLHYDEGWAERFGSESINVARRVTAHAQNVWMWPSLTTKVIFDIDPEVKALPGRWNPDTDLGMVEKLYNDPKVNTNVYLCIYPPGAAAFGIGSVGGACSKNLASHGVMMSYDYSDMIVARSLAHEIGHNLGINHDFTKTGGRNDPRYDSNHQSCLGQGGIMDYSQKVENDKSQWSTCSVEDFTAQMNANKTCLQDIDPKNPPPNPSKPVLTENECDLSGVFPGLNGVHNINLNGFENRVMCINGICCTIDRDDSGCPKICGDQTCENAVDPGVCDLTKLIGNESTKKLKLCINGSKTYVECTDGICKPYYTNSGYKNSCVEICGTNSCDSATLC